jgi:glycosyltransferase involved in cell wall biosynthesis
MNIALNMIIGQRKEEYLEYALKSTKWVDEHVIVNTGQDDNPNLRLVKEILPKAKIIKFAGTFDFASARNLALDNTESYWVLWQDADEVHFERFERVARQMLSWTHYDAFEFCFYHFLLDVFHYQHIETRKNIFKKQGKRWIGAVHEQVQPINSYLSHDYCYHHYGYTKPQNEIYENWRLYWSLNQPEHYKLKENRNPNDVISDRVTVANPYTGHYPEVIKSFILKQTQKVKDFKLI